VIGRIGMIEKVLMIEPSKATVEFVDSGFDLTAKLFQYRDQRFTAPISSNAI
jgi:hypothetical protein